MSHYNSNEDMDKQIIEAHDSLSGKTFTVEQLRTFFLKEKIQDKSKQFIPDTMVIQQLKEKLKLFERIYNNAIKDKDVAIDILKKSLEEKDRENNILKKKNEENEMWVRFAKNDYRRGQ